MFRIRIFAENQTYTCLNEVGQRRLQMLDTKK